MKNIIIVLLISVFCSGCGSSPFWSPEWDKAETERKQYQELQKQTLALERIATAIEEYR